ncbi:hypothetical protein NFI96_008514 [Prochilodus magdalenae]|nr:hypothetical protein NFI96_008514 [Prochilodus magdalenae]
MLKYGDECFEPLSCPCLWKGKEYYPGDKVSSPCHQCVCQHGSFQCQFRPCPSMCTAYGDRHYRTFDGLLFDYIGACKVYLLKSSADVMVSITAENVDCFESGVICRKALLISVGRSFVVFDDDSGKPSPSSVIDRQNVLIWSAGYFTIVHLLQYELSVIWDRKTTVHVQAGPRWQGKLSGLCGNFDLKTVNEMRTPDNMDSATPQEFGNSWTAAECVNSPDIRHPCSLNPLREPFAKRQCGILLGEVFQACHPVVDVTWFYMNCLADTCGCSRGGDCECFCTSVAAYAQRCCHQGITIDWRSPSVCPYDCEYYNKVLGRGPFRLMTFRERNLILAANRTTGLVLMKRGLAYADGLVTTFMVTPGLSKTRSHDSSLVSLEASDRPNYFLHAERSGQLKLRKWEESRAFWDAATFILHRDTWISGFDSLESLMWPGYFLHYMLSRLQLLKYSHSDRYRRATLFKFTSSTTDHPVGPRCQWRYESCTSPCFRTCSDPAAQSCVTILKVEGCLPQCPAHMVLDELTQRCVYLEDCIKPPVIMPDFITTTPTASTSSMSLATESDYTTQTPPEQSSTATTPTTHTAAQLSTSSTTPSSTPEAEETLTTLKRPASSTNPLASTPKTTKPPSTASLTPLITVRTRTASASALPQVTSTTLRPTTSALPTSTTLTAATSETLSPVSTKHSTTVRDTPVPSVSTSRGTTESTSPTFRVSPLDITSTERATVSQLSSTTAGATKPSALSTDSAGPFSAEPSEVTEAPALESSTFTTTAPPMVSAPLHTLTVTPPTITPAHSIEFTTAVGPLGTLKTTPVSGPETREPSAARTTEKTMPTSTAVAKTSTTHLPAKPSETPFPAQTLSSVPQTSESEVTSMTSKTSPVPTTTHITTASSASKTEATETTTPTTDQTVPHLSTTHRPWSPHAPTSERTLPTTTSGTTQTTSTQPVAEDKSETSTKAAVATLTTGRPRPPPTTQVLTTLMTTPRPSPDGTTATFTDTTVSSTESSLSPFSEPPPTSAHLTKPVSVSTSVTVETKTKTTPHTPASPTVTISTTATTREPETSAASSTSIVTTAKHATTTEEPQSTSPTTQKAVTSSTSTLSPVTVQLQTETTQVPPHTDRAALSTTEATQPSSWSPPLYTSSTSVPKVTPVTERVTTRTTPALSITTEETSGVTEATHASPQTVSGKTTAAAPTETMPPTSAPLETAEPVSPTSLSSPFSTKPSTETSPQSTERTTDTSPTALLVSTGTSTTSPAVPYDTTTASERTTSSTAPSSERPPDWMTSATPRSTHQPPALDTSHTASSVTPVITSPYVTETKHWMTNFTTTSSTTAEGATPSRICTPPYSEMVDECTKLICVNGQLLLFNKSQSCPYDSSPPNCGLLGFAVLVNGDKCCPKWACPCRCSVFPDLNIVTFDGNNVGIYKAASYVVTRLPNETVSILVQECHSSDNTFVWNFTNLCLAALNITHESNQVLVNRLQRRVSIHMPVAAVQ